MRIAGRASNEEEQWRAPSQTMLAGTISNTLLLRIRLRDRPLLERVQLDVEEATILSAKKEYAPTPSTLALHLQRIRRIIEEEGHLRHKYTLKRPLNTPPRHIGSNNNNVSLSMPARRDTDPDRIIFPRYRLLTLIRGSMLPYRLHHLPITANNNKIMLRTFPVLFSIPPALISTITNILN